MIPVIPVARYVLLIAALFTAAPAIYAQEKEDKDLHSPAEIMQIMTDSKLVYELGFIDEEIPCTDRSDKVNVVGMVRIKEGDKTTWGMYELSDEAQELFREAEKKFTDKNYDEARSLYNKVHKLHPDFSTALTFIGQTYEEEKKIDRAIEYYRKAVAINFYDYMAHWFLADNLSDIGKKDEALQEITLASILNRNNAGLHRALKHIYSESGRKYGNWCFEPQVRLYKTDSGSIYVGCRENWIGYALTQALWKYEPGYRESMGETTTAGYSALQDRECLAVLYMVLASDTTKKWEFEPALKTLVLAVDDKKFYEYLSYELILPKTPTSVFGYSEEYIRDLKDYVINIRSRY